MKLSTNLLIKLLLIIVFISGSLLAGEATYQLPPKAITDIVDAPWTPRLSVSPNHDWILLMQYPGLPSIEEVSKEELRLAGLRLNPKTFGKSRGWYYTGLKLRTITDDTEFEINGLPEKRHITNISWSPNAEKIAFVNTDGNSLKLWVIVIAEKEAFKVCDLPLNGISGSPYNWLSDSKSFILKTVASDNSIIPKKPSVPVGPNVRENLGRKAPARTYQDLLKNRYDEQVFEYYMNSQIVRVSLDGETVKLNSSGYYTGLSPSPDGKYLLAEQVHPPYSYTVPYYRFPEKSEVWDMDGNIVYEAADLSLAEEVPIAYGSTRTGRRSISWRTDVPSSLYWVEAKDGGDAGVDAEVRDELYLLDAPFTGEPVSLLKLDVRFGGVQWSSDNLAFAGGWWWKTRKSKSWQIFPGSPDKEPILHIDRSFEDRYSDPGTPLTVRNKWGRSVLLTSEDGNKIYLTAKGASSEGDRPFLDEMDLKTHEATRLFRSHEPYYEDPVILLDPDKKLLLTRREAVTEPPNYFVRDLVNDKIDQLTTFPHPTPELIDVKKEQIRYERSDSVTLTATLYLPPDFKEGDDPLPMLMWAYPREFKSADAAAQVKGSPYKFIRISWGSPLIWLSLGYAVLDNPSMPIIGEEESEPNDKFVEQLVASAQAAVDEVVKRGVADPERLAIGGHSYGAFMTANLLAHSDLYRLGIARSGAYNRTLTPFGFQSEERTLWEAPDIYFGMSPFMHAEKIDEPILLIHGEADNNSGTYPLQSERFYTALKGHGATVRLVMLPNESHGYRARESVLHMLYESSIWLDRFVKNAESREHLKTKKEAGTN